MESKPVATRHIQRGSAPPLSSPETFVNVANILEQTSFGMSPFGEDNRRFTSDFIDSDNKTNLPISSPEANMQLLGASNSLQNLTHDSSSSSNLSLHIKKVRQSSTDKPTTLKNIPPTKTKSLSNIHSSQTNNLTTVETKHRTQTKSVKSRYKLTAPGGPLRANQSKQLTPPKSTRPPINKVIRKVSTPYSNISQPPPSLSDFSISQMTSSNGTLGESVLHPYAGEQSLDTLTLEDKLDIQSAHLVLATHLSIMTQKACHDKEKDELLQLAKLHAYKRDLQAENFNLQHEMDSLEMKSLANFTLDELSVIQELFDKLDPAIANLLELQQALKVCQSQIKLDGVTLHPRDREQFQKQLLELQEMLAQADIDPSCDIMATSNALNNAYKALSTRLEQIQLLTKQVDGYASYVLERVSLESHISLLESEMDKVRI